MLANRKLGAAAALVAAATQMVTVGCAGSLTEVGRVTVPNAVGGEGIATS